MGLTLSKAQKIFVDSAPFIYYFEENERYLDAVDRLFRSVSDLQCQLVTSIVTYIELLTMPEKVGDLKLAAKYRDFLTNSEGLSIHPLDVSVADAAVRFRARYRMRTPDAIQLATAQTCGADYVVTNDKEWLRVKELHVVLTDDLG